MSGGDVTAAIERLREWNSERYGGRMLTAVALDVSTLLAEVERLRAEREALAALAWSRGVSSAISGRDDTSGATLVDLKYDRGVLLNPYLHHGADA